MTGFILSLLLALAIYGSVVWGLSGRTFFVL